MGRTAFQSVNRLLELLGPVEPRLAIDWPAVQLAIGSVLPVDYRQLVEITGPIRVADFVGVFAPGNANPNIDLLVQMGARLGALQALARDGFRALHPLWFEPGGLLPWGGTDNGDTLYWLTRGHPDRWTVVVGEARGPVYEDHPLCASDFLVEFLSGRLKSAILESNAGVAATVAQMGGTRASA
jgi:hypothetical protein